MRQIKVMHLMWHNVFYLTWFSCLCLKNISIYWVRMWEINSCMLHQIVWLYVHHIQNIWTVFKCFHSGHNISIIRAWQRCLKGPWLAVKSKIQNQTKWGFHVLQVSHLKSPRALQLFLSRPCFHLITTALFRLWALENISKCTKIPPVAAQLRIYWCL